MSRHTKGVAMKKERAPALTEGLRIIEKAVASKEPITFESILADVEMSRSSVNRLIKVLLENGYLNAVEGHRGGYIPGLRLFALIRHLGENRDLHFVYLKNQMAILSQKTKTAIQYATLDRTVNRITIMQKAECEDSLKVAGYGVDGTPWAHRHVLGKLILAYCEEEEKDALMSNNQPAKLTKHTTLPGPEFDQLLKQIRQCGYAEDHEEHAYHIFRTGLPVFSQDGVITGAVCAAWYAPAFDENVAADLRKGLQGIVDFLNTTSSKK
jgi:IclR family transcriptional regulator, KDG regulon repressor